jgi:hypothetical protein
MILAVAQPQRGSTWEGHRELDRPTLVRCQTGDPIAFRAFVVRYERPVFALLSAGQRPAPASGTPLHPVFEVFWTMTGEMSQFEADLAQSFGPEEAKRIAFSDKLCVGKSTFGGPGPRKPSE